ncbi:metal ABC transporter ATP-binding protein [Candidatus Bathyarchaeota archaeon]|nr:MAG: metal ABC transporter ATP-binding protein [Candidatus Bathyarchaeota archaeon]
MVELKNVHVVLNQQPVLEDISFSIVKPSFAAVVGPNGAGKTTLLKTMLGIIKPVEGEIRVLGRNPVEDPGVRKLIGYVPQRERIDPLIPVLVKDIILMGRLARKRFPRRATSEDLEKAREVARLLEVDQFWEEPYAHLSGGQQQRVLVARALASEPSLLLLDEPFSAVDTPTTQLLVRLLRELVDKSGVTIILVTHEINVLLKHIDRLMLLNRRIIAFGKPDEVLDETLLTETFLKRVQVVASDRGRIVTGVSYHA